MHNRKVASYMGASGVIRYNMTNNYMFRYILQRNKKVLKGLICALLHLKPEEVMKVEITNPINLAGDFTGKEFILDINIMLNDNTQYEEVLPVIHIGFLDFTLHPEKPEFYATYKMMNVKNHFVYSDKFVLSVVNLNQIELATKEDKAYQIDHWARIFKAKTWEEIKVLAKDNEYLQETAESLYVANADEIVRQQCRAREDAERLQRTLERDNKIWKEKYAEATQQLDNQKLQLQEKDLQIAELKQRMKELMHQNA